MIETLRADGDISSINGLLDILQRNIAEADSGGGGGAHSDMPGAALGDGEAIERRKIENLLDTMPPHQLSQIGKLAQERINAARTLRRTTRGAKMNNATGIPGTSKRAYMPRTTRARSAAATGALVGNFIEKEFDGEMYSGEVVSFNANCGKGGSYHIKYEDGDEEDLSPDEVIAGLKNYGMKMSKVKAKAKKAKMTAKEKKEEEDEKAPSVTGKRKAGVGTATVFSVPKPKPQVHSEKRARTTNEPASLPKHPRGEGAVKTGWKLRKTFPGHGPSSNCFRMDILRRKLFAACAPHLFFFS